MCPFVSVETGQVLDTKFQKRFLRTMKELLGNSVQFCIQQSISLGIMPNYIKNLTQIVAQSYKGHVTVVPSPTFDDYRTILQNVDPNKFHEAF